ncbi:MAG: polysaccharide deacetylase family protein [Anaerolineae bacterium]
MNRKQIARLLLVCAGAGLLLAACGWGRPVRIRPGPSAVTIAGEIPAEEEEAYHLEGTAGEILAVSVVSPSGQAHLAIEGVEEGQTLLHPASKTARWAGVLPATQDYVVRVVGGRQPVEYLFTASLLPDVGSEDPDLHFAGVYHVVAPAANAFQEMSLYLSPDGSARLVGLSGAMSPRPVSMDGRWQGNEAGARVELSEQDGEPFPAPETFALGWKDGHLVISGQDDHSWRTDGLRLAPAQGDYHWMIQALHSRLLAAGVLAEVGDGLEVRIYGPATRRAVMAFQKEQGLAPDGVADAAVWAALEITLLPERTAAGEPIVYLTFDDGPDGRYTPQILEILARYRAQATFFVLGQQALYFPELVRAEAEAGHYIASHGYTHDSLEGMRRDQLLREINKTERLLHQAAGDLFAWDGDVHFLRPPYGLTDENVLEQAAGLGYVAVMWDVDSHDWQRPGTEAIVQQVLGLVQPGDIVLMHDGGGDRSQTVAALEIILFELSGRGYRFQSIFGGR